MIDFTIPGQPVGKQRPRVNFTEAEKDRIRRDYAEYVSGGRLQQLADEMGRPKHSVCRQARALGLTDQQRDRGFASEAMRAARAGYWQTRPHPRGFLSKNHQPEALARISEASKQAWASMTEEKKSKRAMKMLKPRAATSSLAPPRPQASWKAGWREVGGRRIYFRSKWEANYGFYLEWLRVRGDITAWEHEPEVFWFEKIKRGCRSYLPDFRVTENDGRVIYHEVKGWMDDRSKTKIKRMRIYHPKVVLAVIDKTQYAELKRKVSSLVPGWES